MHSSAYLSTFNTKILFKNLFNLSNIYVKLTTWERSCIYSVVLPKSWSIVNVGYKYLSLKSLEVIIDLQKVQNKCFRNSWEERNNLFGKYSRKIWWKKICLQLWPHWHRLEPALHTYLWSVQCFSFPNPSAYISRWQFVWNFQRMDMMKCAVLKRCK